MKIVLVCGTNGKTTTSSLIKTILETNGKKVVINSSGANLLNGIASILLLHAKNNATIKADYAIFEVDENALPYVLAVINPHFVIMLNLFRDQLDRYGEVASIAKKWTQALLSEESIQLILNADDPQIAYIGQQLFNQKRVRYFGLNQVGQEKLDHAVDSIYCPRCNTKLQYKHIYFSHLGDWECSHCNLKRPQLADDFIPYMPLHGTYNKYNVLAATLLAHELGLSTEQITQGLRQFHPAFGRQEIIQYNQRAIQLFLSKNPTGFNESIRTIQQLGAKTIILALNDRIADGTDISWIWDIDTQMLNTFAKTIIVTGDRAFDMGLRIKYSATSMRDKHYHLNVEPDYSNALQRAHENTAPSNTIFILSTYTAMLDIRKIVIGKKIL